MVDRSYIRVKSMVVLRDEEGRRQLVWRYPADLSRPAEFHRLIGGSVVLGERARDAALREVHEELGVSLDPTRLRESGVVENLFEFEGEPGHEIVFIFSAPAPEGLVPDGGAWFADDGLPMYVEWRPDTESAIPLYPDGITHRTRAYDPG